MSETNMPGHMLRSNLQSVKTDMLNLAKQIENTSFDTTDLNDLYSYQQDIMRTAFQMIAEIDAQIQLHHSEIPENRHFGYATKSSIVDFDVHFRKK